MASLGSLVKSLSRLGSLRHHSKRDAQPADVGDDDLKLEPREPIAEKTGSFRRFFSKLSWSRKSKPDFGDETTSVVSREEQMTAVGTEPTAETTRASDYAAPSRASSTTSKDTPTKSPSLKRLISHIGTGSWRTKKTAPIVEEKSEEELKEWHEFQEKQFRENLEKEEFYNILRPEETYKSGTMANEDKLSEEELEEYASLAKEVEQFNTETDLDVLMSEEFKMAANPSQPVNGEEPEIANLDDLIQKGEKVDPDQLLEEVFKEMEQSSTKDGLDEILEEFDTFTENSKAELNHLTQEFLPEEHALETKETSAKTSGIEELDQLLDEFFPVQREAKYSDAPKQKQGEEGIEDKISMPSMDDLDKVIEDLAKLGESLGIVDENSINKKPGVNKPNKPQINSK